MHGAQTYTWETPIHRQPVTVRGRWLGLGKEWGIAMCGCSAALSYNFLYGSLGIFEDITNKVLLGNPSKISGEFYWRTPGWVALDTLLGKVSDVLFLCVY